MGRNKGGRPPKKTEDKANQQIHIRLTLQEYNALGQLENDTGLTRTNLFRKRVLENQSFIVTKDVITQLSTIGADIGKIGSNINQLAKHANTITKTHDLPPNVVADFNNQMKIFLEQENELHKLFRLMYRIMKG